MNTMQSLSVERRMHFMPRTVEPSDSVAHARALLEECGIKHLPVIMAGRLVGIISSRDLQTRGSAPRRHVLDKALEWHPDRTTVREVMTTRVDTANPSDTLRRAAELMRRKHVGALPVLERGHLVGIITRSDIGRAALDRQAAELKLKPAVAATAAPVWLPYISIFRANRWRSELREKLKVTSSRSSSMKPQKSTRQ
jgi:acetoin utilization protein AcuB